jgi:glucokinase
MNVHNKYWIGVDVGASFTKIGVVDASGKILAMQSIPSHLQAPSSHPFVTAVSEVVGEYLQQHAAEGIGFALCSLINAARTGAFLSVNAPALNNLDIRAVFEARFGVPTQVMNDVSAYAQAEARFGAGRGVQRLLCLALGTGLAVAAIYGGKVLETWGGVSADAARVILEPDSERRCKAGVCGTAEALCGIAYIEQRASELYPGEELSAQEIITAARESRDPRASQILSEVGQHAGHLLALISPIFFPQRIVVTGGTAQAGEILFTALRQRFQALIGAYLSELNRLESGTARQVEILPGQLGPEAAVIGATLALDESPG